MKKYLLYFFICALLSFNLKAQSSFSDATPIYKQERDNFFLDRIEYTSDKTIFYARFVPSEGIALIFYDAKNEKIWYLKDKDSPQKFETLGTYNVKVNGNLKFDFVRKSERLFLQAKQILTLEIHFPRLPKSVSTADIINVFAKTGCFCFTNINITALKKDESTELEENQIEYGD